jgi:hypothetical protein
MPFIRYRLGDWVTRGPTRCACGAACSTLAAVHGRTFDCFELPQGRAVHPYRLATDLVRSAPWLRQFHIVQERTDRIRLRVATLSDRDPPAGWATAVQRLFGAALGEDVSVETEVIDRIPPNRVANSDPTIRWCRAPRGIEARAAEISREDRSARSARRRGTNGLLERDLWPRRTLVVSRSARRGAETNGSSRCLPPLVSERREARAEDGPLRRSVRRRRAASRSSRSLGDLARHGPRPGHRAQGQAPSATTGAAVSRSGCARVAAANRELRSRAVHVHARSLRFTPRVRRGDRGNCSRAASGGTPGPHHRQSIESALLAAGSAEHDGFRFRSATRLPDPVFERCSRTRDSKSLPAKR